MLTKNTKTRQDYDLDKICRKANLVKRKKNRALDTAVLASLIKTVGIYGQCRLGLRVYCDKKTVNKDGIYKRWLHKMCLL